MQSFAAAVGDFFDELRQLARGLESAQTPFVLYRPRQPASLGFLAQVPKNPCQFVHARLVDQPLRRQLLPRVHPHVERTALLKTEAPFHPIELRRTHTQIQQHAVDWVERGRSEEHTSEL